MLCGISGGLIGGVSSGASLGEMQSLVMSSQKALTREALKKNNTQKPNKTA